MCCVQQVLPHAKTFYGGEPGIEGRRAPSGYSVQANVRAPRDDPYRETTTTTSTLDHHDVYGANRLLSRLNIVVYIIDLCPVPRTWISELARYVELKVWLSCVTKVDLF